MPIDFTQIETGEDFELLCEDLLRAMDFTIEAKVARGPDLGKDIIATKTVPDDAGFDDTHRYLIECKHYAKGGHSVREADIGSPIARMGTHNCDRYILATTTVAAEKTRVQIDSITNTVPHYKATVWHKGDLTRFLDAHPDVLQRQSPAVGPTPAGDRVRLVCSSKGALSHPAAVVTGKLDVRGVALPDLDVQAAAV